jgi:hypothetical protein
MVALGQVFVLFLHVFELQLLNLVDFLKLKHLQQIDHLILKKLGQMLPGVPFACIQ